MTLSDKDSTGQEPPPRKTIPVAIVTAVIAAGAVITIQTVWPWTAPAIHDGVSVFRVVVGAAVLSIRRRKR